MDSHVLPNPQAAPGPTPETEAQVSFPALAPHLPASSPGPSRPENPLLSLIIPLTSSNWGKSRLGLDVAASEADTLILDFKNFIV